MNILFFDMGSYLYRDILDCLLSMGHEVHTVYYHFDDRYKDDYFCQCFSEKLRERHYDLVLSVNFFPLPAVLCHEAGIPYVAWSCDSPLAEGLEDYFDLDTNRIYLFDREETEYYRKQGHTNVFHLPLAVNTDRLASLTFPADLRKRFSADVSFVGMLYENNLQGLMAPLDDFCRGYLQGAMDSQMVLTGCDLITPLLTEEFMNRVNARYKALSDRAEAPYTPIQRRGLAFALQKQITFAERFSLLSAFGELCDTAFYSTKNYDFGSPVRFCGPVKYHTEMPAVFRFSALNLCPTLRSIISGIPLRSLDIMACGGALLSNAQPELVESFTDGEDLILYNTPEEALDKGRYYLAHRDELETIARSGQEKVRAEFSYPDKIKQLLEL